MKKFIPVVLGLLIPLAGAMADTFVDEAVSFCRSKGGAYTMADMVAEGDNYCRQVRCSKTTSDRLEIPAGAPGPEANVEATKKVCVPKSQIDGNFEPGRNSSGSSSGASSGASSGSSSGASSGSASGASSGASSGSASGASSGASSGSASGAQSGADGGGYAIVCDELTEPLSIYPGDRCWNACKPRRGFLGILGAKKEGGERASCIRCLRGQYPNARWRDGNGRGVGGVNINGVRVGTGVIQCRRVGIDGATFSHNGTVCPSGSVIVNGQVVSTGGTAVGGNGGVVISGPGVGNTAVGGNGGIVISGGVGGNAGAQGLPAICQSTKKSDQEACDLWIRNNARFQCSSGGRCIDEGRVTSRYDRDCVNCGPGARQQSTLSGIAEIAGALAPPLAMLGVGYFNSRAQIKSNEAWAGAAAVGFEQCQIGQNNFYQYLSANEAPVLTPQQQAQMNCNGYQLNQFGGLGGGFGGLMGAGYSPGFIGGMMGPYGGYNPYGGMGGMAGGFAGGFQGGMAGGFSGGFQGGFQGGMAGGMYPAGGFAQGISLAGGVAAGMYNGGMAGGMYPAGGMAAGGYMAAGMAGGMYPAGGMYQGGMMAGGMYPAGGMSGLASGGYLAGGIGMAGGMYPAGGMGMAGGMYPAGGMGMASGGYMAAGMAGGMYPAGGYNGGINPYGGMGGWGSGVGTGGMYPGGNGGYFGGAGGFGGNSGYLSQQTSNYDLLRQQQGLSYNMGQMSQGGMGGYGAAGYSPMNMGGMLGGGFQIGGQIGGGFY